LEKLKQNGARRERWTRIVLLVMSDMLLIFISLIIASWLQAAVARVEYQFMFTLGGHPQFLLWQVGLFILIYIVAFYFMQLYSSIWSSSGLDEAVRVVVAVGAGGAGCLFVNFLFFGNMAKTLLVLSGIMLVLMLFASRFGYRVTRGLLQSFSSRAPRGKKAMLVVGAGFFGAYVKSQIEQSEEGRHTYIAMFVDDDPAKANMRVGGVRVRGTIADIPKLVLQHNITEILIAIPSLSERRMAEVAEICSSTKCHVRTVPRLGELETGKPTMQDIREMNITDILFRPEVELDEKGIRDYISHKTVLITGGGGSIGSEIARQVAKFVPATLILFDNYENTTYELFCELKRRYPWLNVVVQVGSVRDEARLAQLMSEWKPDLVVHTAAHKHVPLMEESPAEAVKNNVQGTLNVLQAASESGVQRFVQLSTDKAVNPTNVMGASKRVTELLVQDFAASTAMKCMTVRFGNVLGSQGSVIPLFERQIKAGGPVLVTHPEITRYFMTIPEAAQLVLQAGAMGDSGAIYVLDMGQPVRIMDLAEKVIRFYGYEPHKDISIEITGLRAGEKMYEELLMDEEADQMQTTAHGRIFRAHSAIIDRDHFSEKLETLFAVGRQGGDVRKAFYALVPNYRYIRSEVPDELDGAYMKTP